MPLPPGTDDAGWLRAFHAVVPSVLRAFRPQVLVTQCGADTYRLDPLADLRLTVDGQRATYLALRALADELCEGRWVATGGGGYALVEAVPRAWTHLLATVLDRRRRPGDTATPSGWTGAHRRCPGRRAAHHDDRRAEHRRTSRGSRRATPSAVDRASGHPPGGLPAARPRPDDPRD